MSESDPHGQGGVSVTIKFPESERYAGDNPWIVFHGSPARIREDIIESFNLDESAGTLALSDLALAAQGIASATGKLAQKAGARTLSTKTGEPAKQKAVAPASAATEPASAPASEPVAPESTESGLASVVASMETTTDYKNVWADNRAEFEANPELKAAWTAKAKEIKASGK